MQKPTTAKQRFEDAAARWETAGRPGDRLLTGWQLLVLHRCAGSGEQAENGNPACRCGGELVG